MLGDGEALLLAVGVAELPTDGVADGCELEEVLLEDGEADGCEPDGTADGEADACTTTRPARRALLGRQVPESASRK